MMRRRVDSSMFIAMTYDPQTARLELELHDGAIWVYHDVPEALVTQMMEAPSQGRFFHAWVYDLFEREIVRDRAGQAYRGSRAS